MRTVRTTIQPGVELEVTEEEYTDLSRMGILLTDDKAEAAKAPRNTNKKESE